MSPTIADGQLAASSGEISAERRSRCVGTTAPLKFDGRGAIPMRSQVPTRPPRDKRYGWFRKYRGYPQRPEMADDLTVDARAARGGDRNR